MRRESDTSHMPMDHRAEKGLFCCIVDYLGTVFAVSQGTPLTLFENVRNCQLCVHTNFNCILQCEDAECLMSLLAPHFYPYCRKVLEEVS